MGGQLLAEIEATDGISKWDLTMSVQSKCPPPQGCFWQLAMPDVSQTRDSFTAVDESSLVTCVAVAPTTDDKAKVVREMVGICSNGGSLEDLAFESRLVWELLEEVTFPKDFNANIDKLALPSGLHDLTFGGDFNHFNQSLDNVVLPSGLLNLTFGDGFNQSMEMVLPSGLQNLTFGHDFDQSMDNVVLPSGLQNLTFGHHFNQSLDNVVLPSGLQNLNFGQSFNLPGL